jgi:hypothetical protein
MADPPLAHSLNAASDATRIAVLVSSEFSWRRRLRAALLLGKTNGNAARRAAEYIAIEEAFARAGVSTPLLQACAVYRAKSPDLFALFVPLASTLGRAPGANPSTVSHILPPPILINEIPDYAFDPLHTRLGRRSIEVWLRSYLRRPPFEVRQVAAALWNTEAALCDRTLDWPFAKEISGEAHSIDLLRQGIPLSRHDEIGAWLHAEHSVLACARKAVWESAQRDLTKLSQASHANGALFAGLAQNASDERAAPRE